MSVLIMGAGAAGLTAALRIADHRPVTLLCKGSMGCGATRWAQGGIAAVLSSEDSVAQFVADTCRAGGGLSEPQVVQAMAEQSPYAIRWLADQGVVFSQDAGQWHLTQEGGHRLRRIVHVEDTTGKALSEVLWARVLAHPQIKVCLHQMGVDLIMRSGRCVGAYVLDTQTHTIQAYQAASVILATGGASKVYLYATQTDPASGDGIAMAYRAGARLMDLEFNQFHPTCLYHTKMQSLLLTEALRGEGAYLENQAGERFMLHAHADAELAPRDIVARAIDAEMKKTGAECVYLQASHLESAWLKQRFPSVYAQLLNYGLDLTKVRIPVVPAAHYTCGGVYTDLAGHTTLPGLYAIGETASTGLHGANRLASNSLLECIVMGHAVSEAVASEPDELKMDLPAWDSSRVSPARESITVHHNWDACRRLMSNYFGIVRSKSRCEQALKRLTCMEEELSEFYQHSILTPDFIECRNLVTVAKCMVMSALARYESRGLHCWQDHPGPDESLMGVHTLIEQGRVSLSRITHAHVS